MSESLHRFDPPDQRLWDLTHASIVGVLTDEQRELLEELLNDNPSAQRFYLSVLDTNADLYWRHRAGAKSTKDLTATSELSEGGFSTTADGALPKIEVKPDALSRRIKRWDSIHWQRHKIRFNAMTAVLTALAWVGFSYFVSFSTTPDDSRPNRSGNIQYVAEITGQYEPRWADDLHQNVVLLSGERLNLVEGLIEISFYDGAVVVLEAPTEFVVDSPGAGTLEVGMLAARVPRRAIGFKVDTPTARFVDLGTKFGVVVDEDGVATTHVYLGRIMVEPRRGASWARRELFANQSVRVDHASLSVLGEKNSDVASFERLRHWSASSSHFVRSNMLKINIDTADGSLSGNLPPGYQAYTGQGKTVRFASPFATDGDVGISVVGPFFRNCNGVGYGDVTALTRSGDPLTGYNAVMNSGVLVNPADRGPILVALNDLKAGDYRITFFMHGIWQSVDENKTQGLWDISGTANASDVQASLGFNQPTDRNGIAPTSLANIGQVVLSFAIANDGDTATFTFTPDTLASNSQLWVNGFELALQETNSQ